MGGSFKMKKRFITLVALSLVVAVLLSGCGGGSKKKGSNNVNPFATLVNMAAVPGTESFPIGINDEKNCTEVNYPFLISKTVVTYQLWSEVYNWAVNNGYVLAEGKGEGNNYPVVNVSWINAIVWCNALTEYSNAKYNTNLQPVYKDQNGEILRDASLENNYSELLVHLGQFKIDDQVGNGYRLPTRNEWELAARYIDGKNWTPGNYASGATASVDDLEATSKVAWNENQPMPVAQKAPNALGIYDMSGNVAEWCDLASYLAAYIKGFNNNNDPQKLAVGYADIKVIFADFSYIGFRVVQNTK